MGTQQKRSNQSINNMKLSKIERIERKKERKSFNEIEKMCVCDVKQNKMKDMSISCDPKRMNERSRTRLLYLKHREE